MRASALPSNRPVAFALLAAGRGERFGPGKLTAELAGRPLWRWSVDSAIGAGIDDIHVVTNDLTIVRECAARGWATIANPDAESGLGASIRLAAGVASLDGRLVIALADMPFIAASHLRDLARGNGAAFTRYPDGRSGVPAAFPGSASRRLLSVKGDRGAASLDWPDAVAITPRDVHTLLDVDTPAALERARALAPMR